MNLSNSGFEYLSETRDVSAASARRETVTRSDESGAEPGQSNGASRMTRGAQLDAPDVVLNLCEPRINQGCEIHLICLLWNYFCLRKK